ncbi:SidA/IucD/PvdA family monooxygenase, partial [Enterobacter sp. DRP3]|nr:SidA/IucD/PvdA family monooxygenase [Enterobacter sp. DRP3]
RRISYRTPPQPGSTPFPPGPHLGYGLQSLYLLASDGVTLPLLTAIYQRLYEITRIEGRPGHCALMPGRSMANLHRADGGFVLSVDDGTGVHAPLHADVVLLATGSEFQMPGALESLRFEMHTRDGAPELDDDYAVRWNRP